MNDQDSLPSVTTLERLADLVAAGRDLFVRWSAGPGKDLPHVSSTDDLTGVDMPGLSANALDVEEWWGDRPVRVWVARRLYDYCHLPQAKGDHVRPWVLRGRVVGRGPDNEPLVADVKPVAWIQRRVIDEALREVAEQPGPWGPMERGEER